MSPDRVLRRGEFRSWPGSSALELRTPHRSCPNACPFDPASERAASDHGNNSGAHQSALVGAALYSSSVTRRPHVTGLPESFCCIAMWTMNRFRGGAVPVVLARPEEDAVAGGGSSRP